MRGIPVIIPSKILKTMIRFRFTKTIIKTNVVIIGKTIEDRKFMERFSFIFLTITPI